MQRYAATLLCLLAGCALNVWSGPVEKADKVAEAEMPDKEDSVKGKPSFPTYLQGAKPGWGPPVAFGNASANGNVQGLFAHNNNSLYVISDTPGRPATANLASTASYFAVPINETNSEVGSGWESGQTSNENLAGFMVTAQENVHANAAGDYIEFTNHGASYATANGESAANGTTLNPGPDGTDTAPGSGWKGPNKGNKPKPNVKPKDEDEEKEN